jgi:hypothetical protein
MVKNQLCVLDQQLFLQNMSASEVNFYFIFLSTCSVKQLYKLLILNTILVINTLSKFLFVIKQLKQSLHNYFSVSTLLF